MRSHHFFSLLFPVILLALFYVSNAKGRCLDDQRSLLLQLKDALTLGRTVSTKLANWTSADCCEWGGVACDEEGRVKGLDLSSEGISGGISEQNCSLFSLNFLENLNLAYNKFNVTIPSSFGNLTNLKNLNLSFAGFIGQIPIAFSQLTRLVILDLSTLFFVGISTLQLQNPNLAMLFHNLTNLRELYLDGVNVSSPGTEWAQAISSSVPNLQVLSMSNCYLSGPIDSSLFNLRYLSKINLGSNNLSIPVPPLFANFKNLTSLSLSSSNLHGFFPKKILQVQTLQTLHLENNRFLNGSLPVFPENALLQNLVLRGTTFSGSLPDSIGNLKKLSKIDLGGCNFSGPIPHSMARLEEFVYVDLSTNSFAGQIPSFHMSKNLTYIDLSHNALTGPVPSAHFEGLSKLVSINLGHNSLNGTIPSFLFSLPSLNKILLSNNQFGGPVTGLSNKHLSPLDTLDLSSNKLEGPVPPFFFEFRRLNILLLSFNSFNGTVHLEKIQGLRNLTNLELSYNNLSISPGDSNSTFSSFPQLSTLKLASCNLQKFPELMNQLKLTQLDLSDNQISGELPNWIWQVGNGTLQYLNLSCNLLTSLQRPYTIPTLTIIDLHFNKLSGELPVPPASAAYVDFSINNFNSSIPPEIGHNLIFVTFFSLSNNRLSGPIPQSICKAFNLQVLDLSNNRFYGTIPRCLIESSTDTCGVLNLRNNSLTGAISDTFPQGCVLKTLDLNGNHLEGQVPASLANCLMLEVLNLGGNNISDQFPCFLMNSSSLRVLVLRSNKFQGGIGCPGVQKNVWPKLQIIDLASNNFSGVLPPNGFLKWKAMIVGGDAAKHDLNHLRFEFLTLSHFYYQDTVTVTIKGLEMELEKILTLFTSIDFSGNNFQGEIPETVGTLQSLYLLNLSHNDLTGQIPPSLGNLSQLGSLDLSHNHLSGSIPEQLAGLTFLSFLNLSFNQLVGKIPVGTQIQTFSERSFEGNEGLCGAPLRSCNASELLPRTLDVWNLDANDETDKFMNLSAGLGFFVGLGSFTLSLLLCKKWKQWFDKHVDQLLDRIFHLEDRRRRRLHRQRAYRRPIRRL
ncbi:receptor-like protein 7 [Diospyros lotus]|uniref:receptor-like protein 7 n=1 Tax=Diospyros lotus TaxID=55363 RepID=UPI0022574898|nr:receptor-like protein 7 [Diospyros lotus]